ncbi:MAG: glycosyltransferase family 2 protein [Ghiorsea sp.]
MSAKQPLTVSVAVCTYNGEAYLDAQLKSIACQSRLPDEVIVFDDASIDETSQLAMKFAKEADFLVKVEVNRHQLGVTGNFERAIAACSGDIIVLADQDDVWNNDKLKIIYQIFKKRLSVAMVFSDAEVVDEHLVPLGYSFWESLGFSNSEQLKVQRGDALTVLLRRNVVSGSTMAFRSKFRNLCFPIDRTWPHDAWIAFMLASVGSVALTEHKLIQYRQHGKNVCGAREQSTSLINNISDASEVISQDYLTKANRYSRLVEYMIGNIDCDTTQSQNNINSCVRHLRIRALLTNSSISWINRCSKVLSEVLNRHYFLYSSGWRSVLKDMFGHRL